MKILINIRSLFLVAAISNVFNFFSTFAAQAELSISEINLIARQTTVMIAPGLTNELVKEIENNRNNPDPLKGGIWNPGSGVIVAREGATYYVLTVAHNFGERFVETNTPYGIRTYDRKVHIVKNINDGRGCPLEEATSSSILLRFGCRLSKYQLAGTDLAIVSFVSKNEYSVASIGDSSTAKVGDKVYISGWPDPEEEVVPGEFDEKGKPSCRGRSVRRQRRLAWGTVTGIVPFEQTNHGYGLFYTDVTSIGMSGGPVFNSNGQLIGNHGRGHNPSCIGLKSSSEVLESDQADSDTTIDQSFDQVDYEEEPVFSEDLFSENEFDFNELERRDASSQNINDSIALINDSGLEVFFNSNTPLENLPSTYIIELPQVQADVGKFDFDAVSDAYNDPGDVIDNVYKLFSFGYAAQARDIPSGGCGSVLLEDSCE